MSEPGERRIFFSAGALMVLLLTGLGVAAGCRSKPARTEQQAPSATPATAPVASVKPVTYFTPAPKVQSLPAPSVAPFLGGVPRSLPRCCSALEHRAWSTPEPHNEYTEQAAETCKRAVARGQKPEIAIGLVAAALRGSLMPMECRP